MNMEDDTNNFSLAHKNLICIYMYYSYVRFYCRPYINRNAVSRFAMLENNTFTICVTSCHFSYFFALKTVIWEQYVVVFHFAVTIHIEQLLCSPTIHKAFTFFRDACLLLMTFGETHLTS